MKTSTIAIRKWLKTSSIVPASSSLNAEVVIATSMAISPRASGLGCHIEAHSTRPSGAGPSTRHNYHALFMALPILLCSMVPCLGQQTTGSISGTIKDPTGALISGANITVKDTETGTVAKTSSDTLGVYGFVSLPAGQYSISANAKGFNSTTLSGIELQVYQKAVVDVVLALGSETQTVTVQASVELVDQSTASFGTVVDDEAIQSLPLNLRQVGALALTTPGVVNTTGRSLASAGANGSGFNDNSYAGAGGTSGSNLLLIDGMISRSLNNGAFALNPPPDFVKEFKVQNNVYDAAFGLTSGTVMNLVTQSGTDHFHGAFWEYLRNRDLDARGYAQTYANAPQKPEYIRNQFGGSFGGPLMKDRLFLFGAYEGQRQISGASRQNTVPSEAQKQGEFNTLLSGTMQNLCGEGGPVSLVYDTGQLFDPKTIANYTCPNSGNTILVGVPIPNNDIAAYLGGTSHFDPVAKQVLPLFPTVSAGATFYLNPARSKDNRNQYDSRIDWNLSKKDLIFGRYILGVSDQLYPGAFSPFNQMQHFRGHNVVSGWTHTFSPNLVNDVRIGYQINILKYTCQGCPRPSGTIENFGIDNLAAAVPEFEEYPNFSFSNFPSLGDGFPGYFPLQLPDQLYKYEDTVIKVIKHHTLTFGADLNFWNAKGVSDPIHANGVIDFSGQFSDLAAESSNATTAADLADLELGYPSSGQYTKGAFLTKLQGGQWDSFFGGDVFRVTSQLTIEGGFRWEYRKQPVDANNQLAAFYPLSKSYQPGNALLITAYPDAANNALCSQAYFTSTFTGKCLVATSTQRSELGFNSNQVQQVSFGPKHGDFAPRLGLSMSPWSSGKLVIHAGVGAFLDIQATNAMASTNDNNPVSTQTPTYTVPFGAPPPMLNGVPTSTQQIFLGAATPTLSQISSMMMPSPFYHTPTTWEWSLSVQAQIAQNTAFELAYVGNRGYHEDFNHQAGNQPKPNTATTQAQLQLFRPWPDFNQITYDTYDGYSNYNAMNVKLTQRHWNNLSGLIVYSYGKELNINGGTEDGGAQIPSFSPQDDNNPRAEYAVADSNIAQRLVVSETYQLPLGRGQRYMNTDAVPVNAIASGWEMSAIITDQTGFPFTVYSGNDFSNTGSPSPRPDRSCNGNGKHKVSGWFDVSCFPTTALQTALANGTPRFGNSGRNILVGPGFVNFDTSLSKRFDLFKRAKMNFTAGAFNLFNHPNYSNPNAWIGSSTVGEIHNTVGNSRELQLSLKATY
jgi:hypothetical protein